MRLMLSALFLLCCVWTAFAQDQKSISGKLLIFSGEKQVGDETYHLTRTEAGAGSDALKIGGNAVSFTSQTEYRGTHPASFMLEQGGAKVIFSITGAEVKVAGAREATGQTDPEALILENNVWYQYYFLVQRYDRRKGGVQQFKAFVPSIMQTIPLTLELKGFITPRAASATRYLQYRAVAADSLAIDIITTEKDMNTPIVISVEGQPKYHARPGAFKGRKAIRIDEPLAAAPPPKSAAAGDAAKQAAPAAPAKKK